MDPLDFLDVEQLREFFRRHKTGMSCMDNAHMFLCQLRDHNLVPEDTFMKMRRMRSKDNMRKALYDVLDLLGKKESEYIRVFWECVFKEPILNKYPYLKMLRNSLFDGSYRFYTQLPERVEKEDAAEKKTKHTLQKKRKLRAKSLQEEGEEEEEEEEKEESQPGPSSSLSPKKKAKKICFSSPIKKGEKNDIWMWPIYKSHLPVTCGGLEGTLARDKLSKGEKCILFKKQWFTPNGFQSRAGMKNYKNWKGSILCSNTPLGKLIKEGHLTAANYKGGKKKQAKGSSFSSDDLTTEVTERESSSDASTHLSVGETDEGGETEAPQPTDGRVRQVFPVTCGDADGKLHSRRFAAGTRGKSIRTQTSWLTPEEFVKGASSVDNPSWRRDILWEGKPLSDLIETGMLRIHSLICTCPLCCQEKKDQENHKNDDECCVCKGDEGEELVVCDYCPRSFHQMCHLPHVDDDDLSDEGQWSCTFCIYTKSLEWRYSNELHIEEETMSQKISKHMLECQYLLLYLYSADEIQLFATDPSLLVKDYTKVIKTPMWLGKVAERLQKNQYETVGQFVSDVQLIFTNCASYNKHNAEFLSMGSRLKELFDKELREVFKFH